MDLSIDGQIIQELQDESGVSDTELAAAIDVSYPTLKSWKRENGIKGRVKSVYMQAIETVCEEAGLKNAPTSSGTDASDSN